MKRAVLTLNSGSSSLKASLFRSDGTRRDWRYAQVSQFEHSFERLIEDLSDEPVDAIGHRFVHGGDIADAARVLDAAEIARLQSLQQLAPLHMPNNLLGVSLCQARFAVPQVACFDTAFHHTLPELARRLPIPQNCEMRRYGFHGLNYAYIATQLPDLLGEAAQGRIVIAHLGAGSSLCLLEHLKSVDTSMAYTPAGGIPMATRSGDLDPGVMLALAQRYDTAALSDLVYQKMGLLALSDGESSDMSTLLASPRVTAKFAVDYYCQQVRAAIGAFAAKAGGIDALVFSGGIGEHAASIRARICAPLAFLGFELDSAANHANKTAIHSHGFKPVLQIAANEEAMICRLVESILAN